MKQKVIIFDGMAFVNKIKKSLSMKTCNDFAESFVKRIMKESEGYHQVRLIFDKYNESSLKSKTRYKRTKGAVVQFKIQDDTVIQNVSMKSFCT